MVRLAAEGSSLLEATDLEAKRPGPSYSIETLRHFHAIYKGDFEFFFIIGADAFLEIKTWKEYRKLFEYANFVIIQRTGIPRNRLEALLGNLELQVTKAPEPDVYIASGGNKLIFTATTIIDISSTRIRTMVAEGKCIRFLVPEHVRGFIIKEGLYAKDENP
jgi:nicotinate-nucleotide adenylyltransferase